MSRVPLLQLRQVEPVSINLQDVNITNNQTGNVSEDLLTRDFSFRNAGQENSVAQNSNLATLNTVSKKNLQIGSTTT